MRNLVIIAILILYSCSAQCQTLSDSTKLSNKDINVLLQISDDRNKLEREVANLSERADILSNRIKELNDELAKKRTIINGYEVVIIGYQKSENDLIEQRTNLEKELKKITRKLKWAKTKLFIFAGVVVTGAAALLIIK